MEGRRTSPHRLLILFIAIRQRPASGAEWPGHFGIFNSNRSAAIEFCLKHDGVRRPSPKAPCAASTGIRFALKRSEDPGTDTMDEIVNNKPKHRYELAVDGHIAATYYYSPPASLRSYRSAAGAWWQGHRLQADQGRARSGAVRRLEGDRPVAVRKGLYRQTSGLCRPAGNPDRRKLGAAMARRWLLSNPSAVAGLH